MEACRTLAEQFFDVDTDIETALKVRAMLQTQTVNPPVSYAELAMVRHLRRLHTHQSPTDLSPSAWVEAMSSGWLSPDAEKALREEVATARKSEAALREHHDWLTSELEFATDKMREERELAQATIDELRQQIVSLNAEIRANRTCIPSPSCMASRSIWTG